jgi:hypothetical protein
MSYLVTAVLLVLAVRCGLRLDPRRRFPLVAVLLTLLIICGLALQASWPGAMGTLDNDPARDGWWRPVTSVFLQNGGPVGDLWNVVALAVVAALAEWHWGRLAAAGLFVAGALVPYSIGMALGTGHGNTDPRNWVGSSGATYFLAATLAGALLVRALRCRRWRDALPAAAVAVVGAAAWLLQGNGHGLVAAEGFVLGAVLAVARYERGGRESGGGTPEGAPPRPLRVRTGG